MGLHRGPTYSCTEGWLHVVGDWTMHKPVDADFRPVPVSPGEQSHTVSATASCKSRILVLAAIPRPAIRIQGRSAEVLRFPTEGGEEVAIPPLAVEIDHVPRVDLSQVVQTTPTNLRVRLRVATGAHSRHAWQRVHAESKHLLDRHELPQVTISGTVQGRQGQANFSGEGETRCSLPRDQRPV